MTDSYSFFGEPSLAEFRFAKELATFRGNPQELLALYDRAGTMLGEATADALLARGYAKDKKTVMVVVEAEEADAVGATFMRSLLTAKIKANLACLWMQTLPSPLRKNKNLVDISQEFFEEVDVPDLVLILKPVSLRPEITVAMLHRVWADAPNVPVAVVAPLAIASELIDLANEVSSEFENSVAIGYFARMTRTPRIVSRTELGSRKALSFPMSGPLNEYIPTIVGTRLQALIDLNPHPGRTPR